MPSPGTAKTSRTFVDSSSLVCRCPKSWCAIFEAFIGVSIVSNSCLNPYIFLFFNSDNRKAAHITNNCCINRADRDERWVGSGKCNYRFSIIWCMYYCSMVRSSLVGASTRWINNVNHWNAMQWFILLFMAFWFDKNRMKNNHSNTVQIILNNFNETELVLKACSPWNVSCLMFHVSDVEHDDCLCLRKTKSMEDFVTGRYLELDNYGCCISIFI